MVDHRDPVFTDPAEPPEPAGLLGVAGQPKADGQPEVYQALYRRYRPQRFEDVLGQGPVTQALRNAVRTGKVGHAYLFSGPRGTGKTSTARILAMALNCHHPDDGEPDGTCSSCVEIRRGSSLDVHELDAASNRKLDEMRDLLARVALGTPGRWKVYIIDEVHQLTPDASTALLKTLEEPPAHVVFILATTDPQKVLPTIRSRTQHYEFHLLGSDVLSELLQDVNQRAGLGVAPEAIDLVVRRGHGSARDALSVLDQVAAAGATEDESVVLSDLADALADHDPARALVALAEGVSAGRDPRRLASDLLEHLRNGFLATQARGLVMLPDDAVAEVEAQARRFGLGALVRAMEVIGQATIDMRESVDSRITLEVALVRLASPEADHSPAALLQRIERLERQLAPATPSVEPGGADSRLTAGPAPPPVPPPAPRTTAAPPPVPPPARRPAASSPSPAVSEPSGSPAMAPTAPPTSPPASRPALGAHRRAAQAAPLTTAARGRAGTPPAAPPAPGPPAAAAPSAAPPAPGPPAAAAPSAAPPAQGPPAAGPPPAAAPAPGRTSTGQPATAATPAGHGGLPSRDSLTAAWGDAVLPNLRPGVKAYLSAGRFVSVAADAAIFAVPDRELLRRGELVKSEAEAALAAYFGQRVPLRLILDDGAVPLNRAAPPPEPDVDDPSDYDLDDLEDAGPALISPEQRLLEAFPGAEEVAP